MIQRTGGNKARDVGLAGVIQPAGASPECLDPGAPALRSVSAGFNGDRLLTATEAGLYLGMGHHRSPAHSVNRMARFRLLACVEVGRGCRRFRKADLDAFIESRRVEVLRVEGTGQWTG